MRFPTSNLQLLPALAVLLAWLGTVPCAWSQSAYPPGQSAWAALPSATEPATTTFDSFRQPPAEEPQSAAPDVSMAMRERANRFDPLVDLADPSPPPTTAAPQGGVLYGPAPGMGNWAAQEYESPWLHLGLYANAFYWMYGGPDYFAAVPPPPPPQGKKSLLQRVALTGTYLAGDDPAGLGVTDLELKPTMAAPLPWTDLPLIFTPGLGVHWFDGPQRFDVPGQTYDMYLDLRIIKPITECVSVEAAVTPGWYSDFEQSDSGALRIGGRVLGSVVLSPAWSVSLGAIYLDRDDVPLLPLGGVCWTPNADTRIDLSAPRPKAARRILYDGCTSHWLYLAGEFGGGSWAVQRANGTSDVLNYQDLRLISGWEWSTTGGSFGRLEAGYVFNRQLQYDRANVEFEPDSTFLVRAEWGY